MNEVAMGMDGDGKRAGGHMEAGEEEDGRRGDQKAARLQVTGSCRHWNNGRVGVEQRQR